MAKVNLVTKKVSMDIEQIIRYQLITHCFVNLITVSELDLDCLVMLGIVGDVSMKDFCTGMAARRDSSPQSIRDTTVKLEKKGLIVKDKITKKLSLNNKLKIQTKGNILLDYKIIHVEAQENQTVYNTGILETSSY